MLTLKRFMALADSYGAQLQRWPEEARGDAEALLRVSSQARMIFAKARTLDEAIHTASAQENALLWQPSDQEAALARLRSTVAAGIAASSVNNGRWGWVLPAGAGWMSLARPGWIGLATGSFVVAAGILIGSTYGAAPPSSDLQAMLQPMPIHVLAD
jgi:hypothetical protein